MNNFQSWQAAASQGEQQSQAKLELSVMNKYQLIQDLRERLSQQIIGQQQLVDSLLIALLADGHLLLEGAPGLAKTRAVQKLAEAVAVDYQRVQFTPDLLPGDITGTEIFRPQNGSFEFQPGPIFHNLVLADEINRAPAKVQAALLEAMAERQVSVGQATYPLAELFMVLATQNPIEQEGTYPLPEAQLDRFLMKVIVEYPNPEQEQQILRLVRQELQNSYSSANGSIGAQSEANREPQSDGQKIPAAVILEARREVMELHVSEAVEQYIVQLIAATRHVEAYDSSMAGLLEYGASPRASLALERAARALAWLDQRDYVTPDDVQQVAKPILRHRIIISFEAEAQGLDADTMIDKLLAVVPVI